MNQITLANIRPLGAVQSDELMRGVRHNRNKYQAWLCISGKNTFIGSFSTNLEAGIAYLEAKVKRDSKYLDSFLKTLSDDMDTLSKLKQDNSF